jgi:hemerythrin-like domain-containing protein
MAIGTEVLRREHDAILKVLDAAAEVAGRLRRGERLRAGVLSEILEFLRLFADRCHHGKEEDVLFPLLESKGIPRDGGPIGVMLSEHDEGRAFIREMAEAAETYEAAPETAGLRWADAAENYIALLRAHIQKENTVLFVMAERLLTPDEQARVAEEFEKVEIEKTGVGTHERLHALMGKLLAEFAPR